MQTNTRIQEKSQGNFIYNEYTTKTTNLLKEGINDNRYIVNIDGVDYIVIS